MDNYPLGANTPDAPWNEPNKPDKEIEVTISITLSKTVKISVNDYEILETGKDEDGEYFEDIDYSGCDLKSAVESQVVLPQDAYKYVRGDHEDASIISDLSNWNIDDFEVVLD